MIRAHTTARASPLFFSNLWKQDNCLERKTRDIELKKKFTLLLLYYHIYYLLKKDFFWNAWELEDFEIIPRLKLKCDQKYALSSEVKSGSHPVINVLRGVYIIILSAREEANPNF